MKNKIIEALKNKYKHLGLGEKAFEGAAAFLEPSIKEESEIEAAVASVEPMLKSFQSEADGVRTAKAAAEKRVAELEAQVKELGGTPASKTQPNDDGKDVPAWAQALIDSNKKLSDELAAMKGEKVVNTRKQQLEAIIGKLPEHLRKPYTRIAIPADMSDDDFATMTAEITSEVDGLLKEEGARGAVFGRPRGGGNGVDKEGAEKPTDEEAAAVKEAMGLK